MSVFARMDASKRGPIATRSAVGRGLSAVMAVVVAVAVAAAPLAADAKPGRSSSMGSRGARTYSAPPVGQPIQRSITTPPPAPQPAQPQPGFSQPRPAYVPQAPLQQPGFAQRHPFITGLAGGFLGASIANSLFGHGGEFHGGGAGGAFGGLLRLLMMAGIAWLIWRLVRQALGMGRQQPVAGAAPFEVYTPAAPQPFYEATPVAAAPPPAALPPVSVQMRGEDLQAFEQILQGVMAAWSRGDVAALRRYVTPEILSYYGEELTENQSRGIVNHVADVVLVKGDVVESWVEGDRTYCSAHLRWRARDWTVDEASGRVVDGDEQHPHEDGEVWTFVRADGGRWLLSAIQQP